MPTPATAAARFPQAADLRIPLGRTLLIPFVFTAASGGTAPTLLYDFNGRVTVAVTEGTPDTYTITVGQYVRLLGFNVGSTVQATVNIGSPTGSGSAGTFTFTCTADALDDQTVWGHLIIQISEI